VTRGEWLVRLWIVAPNADGALLSVLAEVLTRVADDEVLLIIGDALTEAAIETHACGCESAATALRALSDVVGSATDFRRSMRIAPPQL
jgi:hypothetical protein